MRGGTTPGARLSWNGDLFGTRNDQDILFVSSPQTASLLGPARFTAAGNFSARSLPAVNGSFPVPQTTFLAPVAPRLVWIGTRLRL